MTDDEIVDFVNDKHDIPLATGIYRKAHLDLVSMAREEERAAIVAWLMREEDDYPAGEYSGFAAMIREEIEAGDHHKGETQ